MKLVVLVAVPPGVVTEIGPVVAPSGFYALDPEVLNPDAVAALAYLADLVGTADEPAGGSR